MACITDCPPPGFSLKLPTIFKEGEVEVPPPVVAQDLGEAPPAFDTWNLSQFALFQVPGVGMDDSYDV